LVIAEVLALPIATSAEIEPAPSIAEQVGAFIDDGDRHIPPVFHGFGLAGLQNFLHVGQGQTRMVAPVGNLLYGF
jgi:hypothetical protein